MGEWEVDLRRPLLFPLKATLGELSGENLPGGYTGFSIDISKPGQGGSSGGGKSLRYKRSEKRKHTSFLNVGEEVSSLTPQ